MELRNYTKRYGDKVIFDNFNLKLHDGKILAIMGPSGRGKTTLLNTFAGLDKNFDGELVDPEPCAYIFQEPRLLKGATVLQNVLVGNDFKDKDKAIELLKDLELGDYINEYPNKLSGGMQQRVSMARAFISGRHVLLMDEAFKGLDNELRYRLYDLFKKLWVVDKPTTVIVTHDPNEAKYLADEILTL